MFNFPWIRLGSVEHNFESRIRSYPTSPLKKRRLIVSAFDLMDVSHSQSDFKLISTNKKLFLSNSENYHSIKCISVNDPISNAVLIRLPYFWRRIIINLLGSISSTCLHGAFMHAGPECAKSCLSLLSFLRFWDLHA